MSNPDVEFRAEPTETPAPEPAKQGADDVHLAACTATRRPAAHYLPASKSLRPPFKRRWSWNARLAARVPARDRRGQAVHDQEQRRASTRSQAHGSVRWRRDLGRLAASSPAYADGRIYVTILAARRLQERAGGRAAAPRTARGCWTKPLPSRTESSPLLAGGRLYFGSEDGTVYALDAKDGSVAGATRPRGAVKGGLALADGKLYFGDYGGRVHAIRAERRQAVWSSSTHGARFGRGSGQFYATPAVAYGRVYIGNTDSNVYSFSARDGQARVADRDRRLRLLLGRRRAGAGRQADRLRRLLRRRFYALDAKSGKVRWKHKAPGRISGAATVVGDIVYFADLQSRTTTGLGARTGRKVFKFGRGGFNPVVSDGRKLYVVGYASLSQLRPKAPAR